MKTSLLKSLIIILGLCTSGIAGDDHDHTEQRTTPNGGRLLEAGDTHLEFFLQPDRKVRVTILDASSQPIPPGGQELTLIADSGSGKLKISFEKSGDFFLTTSALPEGENPRVVLQMQPDANSKKQNFRIELNTSLCEECKKPEYACACSHG